MMFLVSPTLPPATAFAMQFRLGGVGFCGTRKRYLGVMVESFTLALSLLPYLEECVFQKSNEDRRDETSEQGQRNPNQPAKVFTIDEKVTEDREGQSKSYPCVEDSLQKTEISK